jgi:hypothetical protein
LRQDTIGALKNDEAADGLANLLANRLYYAVYQTARTCLQLQNEPFPQNPDGGPFTWWSHAAVMMFLKFQVARHTVEPVTLTEYEKLHNLRTRADYFKSPVRLKQIHKRRPFIAGLIDVFEQYRRP